MAEQPRPGDQQPPGLVEKEPGFMTDFIPAPSGPSLVVSVGHRLGHLACDAEIARLRERVDLLLAAHKRDALAVEAHGTRADHQQKRAAEAEEELARFAAHVSRYDELTAQAAQGQRDSDVLKEIRRRLPPMERQIQRGKDDAAAERQRAEAAEGKLRLAAACAQEWRLRSGTWPEDLADAILAIISGEMKS